MELSKYLLRKLVEELLEDLPEKRIKIELEFPNRFEISDEICTRISGGYPRKTSVGAPMESSGRTSKEFRKKS